MLIDAKRAIYFDMPTYQREYKEKLVSAEVNVDLAIHMYIDNYDKTAQTSLANLDEWMDRKNKVYKMLFRPVLDDKDLAPLR